MNKEIEFVKINKQINSLIINKGRFTFNYNAIEVIISSTNIRIFNASEVG